MSADDHTMVEAEYGVVREVEDAPRASAPRAATSGACAPGTSASAGRAPSGLSPDGPDDEALSAVDIVTRAAATPRYGIEITVPGVCDRCMIKENCYGAGSMVWASSEESLAPGDFVRLEMRPGTVLKATAWVYGIPLVAVVTGVIAGHAWLFASLAEQARVLLSVGLGAALMGASGWVLARLNEWAGRRLTISAHRSPLPEHA